MILETPYKRQLSLASYYGGVESFNYCIEHFDTLTKEELIQLRDSLIEAADLVGECGVRVVIP